MDSVGSFIYLENQFFSHYDLARRMLDRWERNVRDPQSGPLLAEAFLPFAYIVIPYWPQPRIEADDQMPWLADWYPEGEMQILKWLKVRTARILYERAPDGKWVPKWRIRRPEDNVTLVPNVSPSNLRTSSQFKVEGAIELDPATGMDKDPQNEETRLFRFDEVIAKSDIMAFTLVILDGAIPPAYLGPMTDRVVRPSRYSGPPPDRLHRFLTENHVYVHAKAGCFLKPGRGEGSSATVGSANTNGRSLDDSRPDSEMNILWRDRERVKVFYEELADHAASTNNEREMYNKAFDGLNRILTGAASLEAHLVRLDVVERAKKL